MRPSLAHAADYPPLPPNPTLPPNLPGHLFKSPVCAVRLVQLLEQAGRGNMYVVRDRARSGCVPAALVKSVALLVG